MRAWHALLTVALVAACVAPERATRPSPSPFEFKDASTLVLKDTHVPSGYRVRLERSLGAFEVGEALGGDTKFGAGASDVLIRDGLYASYGRFFEAETRSWRGVSSIVMLFRDRNGARSAIEDLRERLRAKGCPEVPIAETIGEASTACGGDVEIDTRTAGRVPVSVVLLYFSWANAVAYIGVADDADADTGQLAASLAAKQLAVLKSFGGEEMKIR
jgi:hypothetical protein